MSFSGDADCLAEKTNMWSPLHIDARLANFFKKYVS